MSSIYGDQLLLESIRYESSSPNAANFNSMLKQKLRQQQQESEEDSKWLAESETHLKRLSVSQYPEDLAADALSSAPPSPQTSSPSYVNPAPYQYAPPSSSRAKADAGAGVKNDGGTPYSDHGSAGSSQSHSPAGSLTNTMTLSGGKNEASDTSQSGSVISESDKKEPAHQNPTANLDRTHDRVYESTTDVVRAVMALSQGVRQSDANHYLDLVKKVGVELRCLLASVDEIVSAFPGVARREVEMAHQVLSKDMAELVDAMKLAQRYGNTTLDAEYRKGMLGAAHVLAMDSKNLLDVVDSIRIRHPHINKQIFKSIDSLPESDQNLEQVPVEPESEVPQDSLQPPFSPTPVGCTLVQTSMYTNNVQSASSSNLSTSS